MHLKLASQFLKFNADPEHLNNQNRYFYELNFKNSSDRKSTLEMLVRHGFNVNNCKTVDTLGLLLIKYSIVDLNIFAQKFNSQLKQSKQPKQPKLRVKNA